MTYVPSPVPQGIDKRVGRYLQEELRRISNTRSQSQKWDFEGGIHVPDNIEISAGDADDLTIKHDGSRSIIKNNTGVLRVSSSGNGTLEFWDDSATFDTILQAWAKAGGDRTEVSHDGSTGTVTVPATDGDLELAAPDGTFKVDVKKGEFCIREAQIDDDASATFALGGAFGFCMVVSEFSNSHHAFFTWTGTAGMNGIYTGAAVSLGAGSNPDVDGNTNIWLSTSGFTLNIKNRTGFNDVDYTVFVFNLTTG